MCESDTHSFAWFLSSPRGNPKSSIQREIICWIRSILKLDNSHWTGSWANQSEKRSHAPLNVKTTDRRESRRLQFSLPTECRHDLLLLVLHRVSSQRPDDRRVYLRHFPGSPHSTLVTDLWLKMHRHFYTVHSFVWPVVGSCVELNPQPPSMHRLHPIDWLATYRTTLVSICAPKKKRTRNDKKRLTNLVRYLTTRSV